MRTPRVAIVTALLLAAAVMERVSEAAPPPEGVSLEYSAPEGCPGRDAVLGEMRRLLGDSLERGAPLRARGDVTKTADGRYRLSLELERGGSSSKRELESKSCETLAQTAALLAALSHDPAAVERAQASEAAPPPTSPPPPPPETAPPPPPPFPAVTFQPPPVVGPFVLPMPRPHPPSRSVNLGFRARLGPAFGIADLPDPHAGVSAAVAIRLDAYSIEAAGELGIGSTGTTDERPNAGADFTLIVGILRGCRVLAPFFTPPFPRPQGRFDFGACLGFEIGSLSGQGFGVSQPERGEAPWIAPRLDLRLGLGVIGPLSLGAEVGIAVPLDRRRFVIQGGTGETLVVHEPGPIAGRLGAVAELEF